MRGWWSCQSGSLASTALLLNNGIASDRAGKGLALHPAPFVLGDFPFEVRANQGIPMAYTLHQFGVTNGVKEGGFLVEGIFLPPFQFSMALPVSGGQHNELMKRYQYFAMAGILVRDHSNGVITVTDDGTPKVSYSLGPMEVDIIARGVEAVSKMWFGLGASRVITSHMSFPIVNSADQIPDLVKAIREQPRGLLLGSAHPQGGNRMGDDPSACVVDSNCRVHGYRNLFVCDASVFPTSLGVNPQLTVMSLATIVSDRINKGWDAFATPKVEEKLGQLCAVSQPMYCRATQLDQEFEISDTILASSGLVNSDNVEIIDGENWSFDPKTLMIWNDRYWKGFFAADPSAAHGRPAVRRGVLEEVLAGRRDGGRGHPPVLRPGLRKESGHRHRVSGVREGHPPEVPRARVRKVLRPAEDSRQGLHPREGVCRQGRPEGRADTDVLDVAALLGRLHDPGRLQGHLRDQVEEARHRRGPRKWEGRFVSDSAVSPPMFRFTYLISQGALTCEYDFGGVLPGKSTTKFTKGMMDMFDFTGTLMHDEIRMVQDNFMVGKYVSQDSPVFRLLKDAPGFTMVEGDSVSLPYTLRRAY